MSNTKFQRTPTTLNPGDYHGTYKFVGGSTTLDFVNTISWRGENRAHEWLTTYTNFIDWAYLGGLLSSQRRNALLRLGEKHPLQARQVVHHAIALREALHEILRSLASSKTPSPRHTSVLNSLLSSATQHLQLASQNTNFTWVWKPQEPMLDEVLWHIAWSAGNYLLAPQRERLGNCDDCGWVFLDTTKNHTRKWCTMEDCGNRAKARRHRSKLRSK